MFDLKETHSHSSSGSPGVTPSPTDTEVHRWPLLESQDPSPRRLPTSKASRKKTWGKGKPPNSPSFGTLETVKSSDLSHENRNYQEPQEDSANEYESTPVQVTSARGQRPSVADLRKSFEKMSQPSNSIPTTPIRPKMHSKPSINYSPRRSQDIARPSEVSNHSKVLMKETSIRKSHDTSQMQSSPLSRKYVVDSKGKQPGFSEPVALTSLPINTNSKVLLPTSNRSYQRPTLLTTSNTTNTFEDFDSEPIDLELNELRRGRERERPEDPTSTYSLGLIDESPMTYRLRHHDPTSKPKQPQVDAQEPRIPASRPLFPRSHLIPRPSSKSEPVSRRNTKVSDLRKLFDRPSIRGPSPIPFIEFRRGRARRMTHAAESSAPDLGLFSTESFTTASSQATRRNKRPVVVAPELTTKISVNNFECSFDDTPRSESEYNEPPASSTKVEPSSPVKEHIDHFERLDRGSPSSCMVPPGRAKSYDTSNLRFPFRRSGKNKGWGPLRERGTAMWRRISRSFSHSNDGGGSSQHSGSSVNLPAQLPKQRQYPYHKSNHHHHHHYRRGSSLLLFSGYRHRPSDNTATTSTTAAAERDTKVYSSYRAGSPSSNLNGNVDDALSTSTILKSRPSYTIHQTRSSSPPSQRLPIRKSFPVLARRVRLSSSRGTGLDMDMDMGLDGTMHSKVPGQRHEYRRGGGGGEEGGENDGDESGTFSGPDALNKVMFEQSAAERRRRKQEKKQMKRAAKRKGVDEMQGKGKGKEKEKEKDKGKGKAIERPEEEEEEGDGVEEGGGSDKDNDDEKSRKKKERSWSKKTGSGFVVRQATDVNLKHPKPNRPGQVRKVVNMYLEKAAKAASGHSIGSSGGGGKGDGAGSTA
ncbi:hypothetical protein F4810DRAFT_712998 [Camillea tinctor]|nr:hypothetical protein F4810DRAFT_712998 [Camillea tinctor]